jgi:hypothetical protein
LAQRQKPKLSSAGRELKVRAEADPFVGFGRLCGTPPELIDEVLLFDTFPMRRRALTDLANLRDAAAIAWFWGRWAGRIRLERQEDIMGLRDELRAIWNKPDSLRSQQTLDRWLLWTPSHERLALDNHISTSVLARGPEPWDYMAFRCSVRARKLVPNVYSLRAMLIQGIFEHWQHFRFCTNPACAAPYFIAKRRDQTVCDAGDCKAMKQREHALKWWKANRANKSSRGKNKERSKHGTRKTR